MSLIAKYGTQAKKSQKTCGRTSEQQVREENFIVSAIPIYHLNRLRDLYKMFDVKVVGSIDDDFEARVKSFEQEMVDYETLGE